MQFVRDVAEARPWPTSGNPVSWNLRQHVSHSKLLTLRLNSMAVDNRTPSVTIGSRNSLNTCFACLSTSAKQHRGEAGVQIKFSVLLRSRVRSPKRRSELFFCTASGRSSRKAECRVVTVTYMPHLKIWLAYSIDNGAAIRMYAHEQSAKGPRQGRPQIHDFLHDVLRQHPPLHHLLPIESSDTCRGDCFQCINKDGHSLLRWLSNASIFPRFFSRHCITLIIGRHFPVEIQTLVMRYELYGSTKNSIGGSWFFWHVATWTRTCSAIDTITSLQ